MRELTIDEMELVSGGGPDEDAGFFEQIGWFFDNPGSGIGFLIDYFVFDISQNGLRYDGGSFGNIGPFPNGQGGWGNIDDWDYTNI